MDIGLAIIIFGVIVCCTAEDLMRLYLKRKNQDFLTNKQHKKLCKELQTK